jgi:hypothetical protein
MADFDKLSDTKGRIINFIEEKAWQLFYNGRTEYDFSSWVQTALLIENIIIPCEYYIPDTLLELAQEVIIEAKSHKCRVERFQVKDGEKINTEMRDFTETIVIIDEWLREERKKKKQLN